jgi:heme-degrading monooxygenase HmoA
VVVVINRLQVPAGYEGRLEEGFRRSSGLAGFPGFGGFELLRNQAGGEYLVVTRWESREAFERWLQSESFQRAHERTNPESGVTSTLAVYEVVLGR